MSNSPTPYSRYWSVADSAGSELSRKFRSHFATGNEARYLTFELDVGGLNNIRMQLEYLASLAAVTGRTLVLPPPDAWYLINRGPISREGDTGGVSHHAEFFDIPALQKWINVVSTAQFLRDQSGNLKIPQEFLPFTEDLGDQERAETREALRKQWRCWQRENFRDIYWNPYHNVLCHPDIQTVMSSPNRPDERFLDKRIAVQTDRAFNESPVVHFASDVSRGIRQLGQISKSIAFADDQDTNYICAFLKYGLRFAPLIYTFADQIIQDLGLFQYSSLHLRRNDIQFEESRAVPETTAACIGALLDENEPIYIASDENDQAFFKRIESQREVHRYADVAARVFGGESGDELQPKFIGCIEQLVCAGGRKFIGTPHSSFSSYIARLRGYIEAPDLNFYHHTGVENQHNQGFGFIRRSLAGRDYMNEDPVLWQDSELKQAFYSVVCTDTNPYAHWQCELLEYSWKQVGQAGKLVRLVARSDCEELPRHRYANVISTKFSNQHPDTGDEYVPYNRLFSFKEWLDSHPEPGTVLILDPDCVFRNRVPLSVSPGRPVAQNWGGFGIGERWRKAIQEHSNVDLAKIQGVTWPALVHSEDLTVLMPRWIEITSALRQRVGAWESDMMAFVVAAAELGIEFERQHLTAVMNFEEQGERAPIIHYCQMVEAKDGGRLWSKQGYRPWQSINAHPADAKLDYCGDLIAILKEFVAIQQSSARNFLTPGTSEIEVTQEDSPRVADDYLLKVSLDSKVVVEFKCKKGDPTAGSLFSALTANSTQSGDDELLSLSTAEGKNIHFHSSQIVAIEAVPQTSPNGDS